MQNRGVSPTATNNGDRIARARGRHDPLGYDCALPLRNRYFPMGFPVDIETNSTAVLDAAGRIWSPYNLTHTARTITIKAVVEDKDSHARPIAAMPRGQGHLMSIVHGPDNFAICDLSTGFSSMWLTRDVVADREYFLYHFLEQATYTTMNALHFVPVHASCVALDGQAVLLCGDSGAGKTSLAYACARLGWTWLAGDATHIIRGGSGYSVAGRPFEIRFRESAKDLFPELRAYAAQRRPGGGLDLEIDTRELNLELAFESGAGWIVFLQRQPNPVKARLERFPHTKALEWLSESICVGDDQTRSDQQQALRQFLTLPIVQLTWSGFEDAEAALRNLVTSRRQAA